VPGNEHRLLVVGGKVVAASRGESAWITGDGQLTVLELVETQINSDPRRGLTEDDPLNRLRIEDDTSIRFELERQGFTPCSIPEIGRRVLIQRNGNVAFDCTDDVHPDVAALVGLAARVVGLDVAGIDLVAEDISRPLDAQGAAVVEVNAGPGLLMHLKPASGMPRPVGSAIVDHLFPNDEDGRIPIIGICGQKSGAQAARLIALLMRISGWHVGLACAGGLFLGSRRVESGDPTRFDDAQRLLMNRSVDAAVFESTAEGILRDGLPYDKCQIGIVTDVGGGGALGEFYINDDDQVFNVLRSQVDVVLPSGIAVLNAADLRVVEMAELCDGSVIFYGMSCELAAIIEHRAKGGRAAFTRNGELVLATGNEEVVLSGLSPQLLSLAAIPVETILVAVATAWALDIPQVLMVAGVETFSAEQLLLSMGTPDGAVPAR
jgi:cyanophycin synthetase